MYELIIIVGLAGLIFFALTAITYNIIVYHRNKVFRSFSQIDVQLKRRCDLIETLISFVKGYIIYESEVLASLAKARSEALGARKISDKQAAETDLTNRLSSFLIVVEKYPELKAQEVFRRLFDDIISTENRIAFARQFYNDEVTTFNTIIEKFPVNVLAAFIDVKPEELFRITVLSEKLVPKLKL